jgi:phosphate transport system substrate-binding protein
MDNLVLQDDEVHPDLLPFALGGMGDMLWTVSDPVDYFREDIEPNSVALGFTVFFFLDTSAWNLKVLDLDGITPSHETILSGEYSLSTNYFAVIRADTPQGHPARNIAEWLATPAGQDVVREAGLGTMN